MTGLLSVAGSTPSEGFELTSCRFEDGDPDYLLWTPTVSGNRKTWTYSCWVKRGNITTAQRIFGSQANASHIYFESNDVIYVDISDAGSGSKTGGLITSQVFRDTGAWMHIVVIIDTPSPTTTLNGSSTDRMRLYVNGSQVTAFSSTLVPAQNYESCFSQADKQHSIGYRTATQGSAGLAFDGYLAESYFIGGSALTPSYFGETNAVTNQWQPKEPKDIKEAVTFGTNGFYLPFSNDALADSFVDSSTFTGFLPSEGITVDYLLVAGGGSSGQPYGGGGGAGELTTKTSISLSANTKYNVTIGAGGVTPGSGNYGQNGGDSIFNGITANGGGGGGYWSSNTCFTGRAGGSGGGGGIGGTTNSSCGGGGSTLTGGGSGNSGGLGRQQNSPPRYRSGGGGGAGAAGTDVPSSGTLGGDGGIGLQEGVAFDINGTGNYYAGGGGGMNGQYSTSGDGGLGGGGKGSNDTDPAVDGTNGTGGGAGGGGSSGNNARGGSGILVIRYVGASAKATGGTITTYEDSGTDYMVHTFTDSSQGNKTITANGDTTNTRVTNHPVAPKADACIIGPKIGSSAIWFAGGSTGSLTDSSYLLDGTDQSDFEFGSGDFYNRTVVQ